MAGIIITDPKDTITFAICSDPAKCTLFTTPSHLYPRGPFREPFVWNILKDCGPNHVGAKDLAIPNIQIGTPVYAAEAGTVNIISYGWDPCGCGKVCNPANFVSIRSASDNYITQYVHVTPLPSLSPGTHVNPGDQIGTVDMSGSSCDPHVHMARYTPSGSPTCNWFISTSPNFILKYYHPYPTHDWVNYHPHRPY